MRGGAGNGVVCLVSAYAYFKVEMPTEKQIIPADENVGVLEYVAKCPAYTCTSMVIVYKFHERLNG